MLALNARRFALNLFFPPIEMKALDPWLTDYLHEWAAPRLKLDPWDIGTIAEVPAGRNSCVHRWEHAAFGTFYARAWRYNVLERPAYSHTVAARLLNDAGLRVPEVVLMDDSFPTLRRFRLEAVIERAAVGEHFRTAESLPPAALALWARDLARIHATTGPHWGRPWQPFNESADPRRFWDERIDKLTRRILGNPGTLKINQVTRAGRFTRQRIQKFAFDQPRLVHGDVSPGNLFFDGDGSLTWIDLRTVHFGVPMEDLWNVRNWLAPVRLFETFMDHYTEAGGRPAGMQREA
ncbi:phosphotransferase, partial [Candidatus Poribacteria bacterium]|nr:phosphotransferase [Candidatus Poribacteria bacterium]